MIPKTIVYGPNDKRNFDLEEYKSFVKSYGEYDEDIMMKELEECAKFPMTHVSLLIKCGVKSLKNKEDAKKFYEENYNPGDKFERLRRITGRA